MPSGASPAAGRRSVAHNAVLLAGSSILARLAMLALAVALGRIIGPEDYGRYGLGVALGVIAVPLTDLGMTPFVTRETARLGVAGDPLATRVARVRAFATIAATAVVALATWLVVDDERTALAIVLVVASASLDGLAQFGFGYFQGREHMGMQARLTSLASLARSIGGIALALATGSLVAVLVWLIVAGAAQAVAASRAMRRATGRLATPTAWRSLPWRTILAMGAMTVFVAITQRADAVILGLLRGEADVGLYTAAFAIMGGLQIIPWTAAVAMGPVFARTFDSDRAAFARTWSDGLRTVLLTSLPIALLVALLSEPLIARLFGAAFSDAGPVLAILIWSVPLAGLATIAAAALRGARHERWLTSIIGAGTAANVALNLWAIDRFGATGAAAVNAGTELLLVVLLGAAIVRLGVAGPPRMPALRMALALAALAAIAVVLRDRAAVELSLAAGAAGYAAVAWATRLVTAADLRAVLSRTPAR